jgi:replicative DNA helicase
MESNNYLSNIYQGIENGMMGLNVGLPMGFDRFSEHVSNIQKGRYDLIAGATGSGKTALVDSAYLCNPYDYIKANPDCINDIDIVYYSLEIDPEQKIAKLIANKLWRDHGIATSVSEIFSKGTHKLGNEAYRKALEVREYFEEMGAKVKYRSSCSPNYLYMDMLKHAEERGTIHRDEPTEPGKRGNIIGYTPNDPSVITLIIMDHIGLITPNAQDQGNLKKAIDRTSKILIMFRNIFKYSPVVVSQFNRAIESHDRMKGSNEPKLSDLKDSGGPSEDANTVIGLYYPFRYGKEEHIGYNIQALTRYYRSLHLLKNRDGSDNLVLGLLFMGQNGFFRELPKPEEIMAGGVSYEQILSSIGQQQNTTINLNNF